MGGIVHGPMKSQAGVNGQMGGVGGTGGTPRVDQMVGGGLQVGG